jgi:hypothetical protein
VRVLSAARALELAAANRAGQPKANIELSPEARMLIKRGPDYVPIAVTDNNSQPLFDRLERSMADRRTTAWQIVEKLLAPQKLTFKARMASRSKTRTGKRKPMTCRCGILGMRGLKLERRWVTRQIRKSVS